MGAPQLQYAIPAGGGVPVGVSGVGTVNRLTKWSAATTIADSGVSDDGTTVSFVARNLSSSAAQTWTLPSDPAALTVGGVLVLNTSQKRLGINAAPGTLLHVTDGIVAAPSYDGIRLGNTSEALFSSSDSIREFRAGLTGGTAVVGTSTTHDLLLQRGLVTAITLGAAGAVTFAGNLTSSAAQTWTLATSTSALNVQSGLLNLDTTNSRVGIGTTTPGAPLDVAFATASNANTARLLYTGAITANEGAVLGLGGYYTGTTATTFAFIKGTKDNNTAGDYAGHLEFWTRPNGGVFTQQVTITSAGNVGIGTASPSSLGANYTTLDIRGSSGGGFKFGNATQYAYMYSDVNGFALSTQTNLPLNFYTQNAQLRASVGSTSLDISSTSGYGIKLPSSLSPGNTDPSTLDCYNESTYTAADNSGAGLVFTVNNVAVVTRVGRLVTVRVDITFPVTVSAAYASISVPFTSITTGGTGTATAGLIGTVLVSANAASFEVYASAPITRQTNANLSGVRLVFSLTYQAA